MTSDDYEQQFNTRFIARVRDLRRQAGWTQAGIAEALSVHRGTWQRYERNRLLPFHLIEDFAAHVGRSIEYVVTGRDPRQSRPH